MLIDSLPIAQMFPGMEWLPLIQSSIVAGVCAGVAAIALRCFRRWQFAGLVLSLVTIAGSTLATLGFWALLGSNLRNRGYLAMAFPAVLSIVALIVRRRPKVSRFSVSPSEPAG